MPAPALMNASRWPGATDKDSIKVRARSEPAILRPNPREVELRGVHFGRHVLQNWGTVGKS